MEEVWKTIEHFDRYDISSEGRVRNNKSGRILTHTNQLRVVISFEGRPITLYIPRLMDEYFGEYDEEVWRTIPEARTYEISTEERVRNRRTGQPVWIEIRPNGRKYVTLTDAGSRFKRPLSYLMETAFGR